MRSPSNDGAAQSRLDQECDKYIHQLAKLDPIAAIDWGLAPPNGKFPDFSPEGFERFADLDKALLSFVNTKGPWTGNDAITAAALRDRLGLSGELHAADEGIRDINNLACPIQSIRDSFDLMPKDTAEDWKQIARQAAAVPDALAGYRRSLKLAAERGRVAAATQVVEGARQSKALASLGSESRFKALLDEAPDTPGLEDAVRLAAAAYGELSDWLKTDLLPKAPKTDGVGAGRYERFSRLFVGAQVDLQETYEWGLFELEQIHKEQERLAQEMYGVGTGVFEAQNLLNQDQRYMINGTDALRSWMQELADQAIRDLSGTEFDIAEPLQKIECMVTSGDGGIYYTGPTADFSRPGRMWWSIPETATTFHTWQERTTVFHEGVPGHHLQIGTTMTEADSLNLWRRLACWNSGHGEGWALYAEALMAELGYQDDPGYRMGMLDSERLRAARVVLDIGVHLGLKRPGSSEIWDKDFARQFLAKNVAMDADMREFELIRYLGWPGQAPSYKVGARLWRQLRDEYQAKANPTLSSDAVRRKFHAKALNLGSLPMSTLREAVLN